MENGLNEYGGDWKLKRWKIFGVQGFKHITFNLRENQVIILLSK